MTANDEDSPGTDERSAGSAAAGTRQRQQILVVEDDEADAWITRTAIAAQSYPVDVTVVGDGENAVRLLTSSPGDPGFDLVLLDLRLPGCDGVEVLERVRALTPPARLPIVVLTSIATDEDTRRCLDQGADAVLAKPADFDGYLEVVAHVLDQWLPGQGRAR